MMQQIDEDYTLTQLSNAWLDLAVEAHLIFQDFSEKYQQTGMILNGKAVCGMHMGCFEEAESLLLEALNRDAKDAETLANLVVCSLHLGKSPSRYLSHLKLTHPDHLLDDRFIPNRSAIDFDMARYLLVDARKGKENKKVASLLKGTYRKLLAEATMMDRTRILSFWRKPHAPTNGNFQENNLANQVKSSQQQRYIPKSADRTLDDPDLVDDYYLNLLDWSTRNILAVALKNKVYYGMLQMGLARSS
ncbi:hypothetical protein AAC387_Pa08g1376 [Persea americana]